MFSYSAYASPLVESLALQLTESDECCQSEWILRPAVLKTPSTSTPGPLWKVKMLLGLLCVDRRSLLQDTDRQK